MEMEKDVDEVVEELMNLVKELFQKSSEELALEDEEILEGHMYEESYQEDMMKFLMLKIQKIHLMR
jgi:hypothetical protein